MGTIIQNVWQMPGSGRIKLTHKDIKTEEDTTRHQRNTLKLEAWVAYNIAEAYSAYIFAAEK